MCKGGYSVYLQHHLGMRVCFQIDAFYPSISVFCWFTLSGCDSGTRTKSVVREGKEIEGLRLLDFVAFNEMIYFLLMGNHFHVNLLLHYAL